MQIMYQLIIKSISDPQYESVLHIHFANKTIEICR